MSRGREAAESLMHNLSVIQALDIWSDLEAAYYGQNRYGRDTAEIYLFRLNPWVFNSFSEDEKCAAVSQALKSLHAILAHFIECKKDIRIFVNERAFGAWVKQYQHGGRVHVRIAKITRKKRED